MSKKIYTFLMLTLLVILSGCKDENVLEEKAEKYISGYVIEKEDNSILIGSAAGNYKFNIENAKIETEDEISIDDMCDIYYYDELKNDESNTCIKIVEFYSNYIVGKVSDINTENDSMKVLSDTITYNFSLDKIDDDTVKNIKEDQMYEIRFDKKLTSSGINSATEINILEVD